jgi:hypothetical protein
VCWFEDARNGGLVTEFAIACRRPECDGFRLCKAAHDHANGVSLRDRPVTQFLGPRRALAGLVSLLDAYDWARGSAALSDCLAFIEAAALERPSARGAPQTRSKNRQRTIPKQGKASDFSVSRRSRN